MRQVRDDELIYNLFDATRGWTASLRNGLASDNGDTRARWVGLCAVVMADKFTRFLIYPDGAIAPMNQAELAALFAASISGWERALRKGLASRVEAENRAARWTVARMLSAHLAGHQILSEGNDPPPFRLDGASGSGVPLVSEYPEPTPGLFG